MANKTVDQCQTLCCENPWCTSFDYAERGDGKTHGPQTCWLSSASEGVNGGGGLSWDPTNNYHYYEITKRGSRFMTLAEKKGGFLKVSNLTWVYPKLKCYLWFWGSKCKSYIYCTSILLEAWRQDKYPLAGCDSAKCDLLVPGVFCWEWVVFGDLMIRDRRWLSMIIFGEVFKADQTHCQDHQTKIQCVMVCPQIPTAKANLHQRGADRFPHENTKVLIFD